jgi:hypothetical protein
VKRSANDQRPSSAIARAVARVELRAQPRAPRPGEPPVPPGRPPEVVLMLPADGSGPDEQPPAAVPFARRPLPRLVIYDAEAVQRARAERDPSREYGVDDDFELFERFAVNKPSDEGSR